MQALGRSLVLLALVGLVIGSTQTATALLLPEDCYGVFDTGTEEYLCLEDCNNGECTECEFVYEGLDARGCLCDRTGAPPDDCEWPVDADCVSLAQEDPPGSGTWKHNCHPHDCAGTCQEQSLFGNQKTCACQ